MKLQTKKIICLLAAIASVMTIVSALSYAYFTAMADVREQSAVLTSGTMRVKFSDNDTGLSAELNFGESVTKRFTIENTGTLDATVFMYWEDLINTYTKGSLTYTLSQSETEDSTYTEVVSKTNVPVSKTISRKNLSSRITIPAGETYYYNLKITLNYLEDVNQDADITAKFSTKFDVGNEKIETIVDKIITTSNGVRTTFVYSATTDEGIFEMEDDYGTSYYYRGAVTNNYVKFGRNASGQDMYWRIIRINGDGSLKIIYTGTQAYANGTNNSDMFIGTSAFNTNYKDAKYVGYMYGPAGTTASTSKEEAQTNTESSTIKIYIDNWYKTNIVDTGFSNAVADILFCNDRTTPGKALTGYSSDTGLGYGTNATAYGGYAKVGPSSSPNNNDPKPTFKCSQKNDAFTVTDTKKGNGALTYPVGLITADEIVTAGSGKYGTANSNYYLYRPSNWWSLSPCNMFTNGHAGVFNVNSSGYLGDSSVYSDAGGVAPVINLSAEYVATMIGDGTMENPYTAA